MTATTVAAGEIESTVVVRSAEDGIIRVFAAFISAAALLFAVLLAPGAIATPEIIPHWWSVTAATLVLVPMLGLWPASRAADSRWIKRCGTAAAAAYLGSLLSWLALVDGHIPANRDVWLATFPGLITMAAALSWRPAATLTYLTLGAGTAEVVRYVTRENQQHVVLPVEIVSVVVYCGLFVVATIAAVSTARALDRAMVTSVQHSATSAASAARDVERARFHALMHDRVMSTLLALSRLGNTPDLRDQAATTVIELDRLRNSNVAEEDLDVRTAVGLIRAALVQVDGDVPVEVDIDPAAPDIPRAAARSIASAAAEALRYSFRQTDDDADRIIVIDACPKGLRVVVADNGCELEHTPQSALDVEAAFGLRQRMAAADGCAYAVHAEPGRGTQVVLAWTLHTGDGDSE